MSAENISAEAQIHPTAIIEDGAKIAARAKVGPYSIIGSNVEIGEDTIIGPHVVVTGWTKIGRECHIYQGASIGEEPQDLKFKGEKSYTSIGDRTVIREGTTVHRATGEGEETRIGNDCLLMALTHVAHNCVIGNRVIMSNVASLAGHAVVEDRAVIGGMTGVHQFVKIGRNAMIGGMSRLTQDVVPYTIVAGQPAKTVGLNSVGISRAGIDATARRRLKQAYRMIFRSGLSLQKALSIIEQEIPSCEEVDHLLRFLRNADRGICRERRDDRD